MQGNEGALPHLWRSRSSGNPIPYDFAEAVAKPTVIWHTSGSGQGLPEQDAGVAQG
jgi:hypothetical protein